MARKLKLRRPRDLLPGGLGDLRPLSAFSPRALRRGTRVEMEHTWNPAVASEIARDHLTEHPGYYSHLAVMEKLLDVEEALGLWPRKHR